MKGQSVGRFNIACGGRLDPIISLLYSQISTGIQEVTKQFRDVLLLSEVHLLLYWAFNLLLKLKLNFYFCLFASLLMKMK